MSYFSITLQSKTHQPPKTGSAPNAKTYLSPSPFKRAGFSLACEIQLGLTTTDSIKNDKYSMRFGPNIQANPVPMILGFGAFPWGVCVRALGLVSQGENQKDPPAPASSFVIHTRVPSVPIWLCPCVSKGVWGVGPAAKPKNAPTPLRRPLVRPRPPLCAWQLRGFFLSSRRSLTLASLHTSVRFSHRFALVPHFTTH